MHAAATLVAQYNNLDSVKELFEANKGEIAGVILEPVVGNSGYIEPTQEFLKVCAMHPDFELCIAVSVAVYNCTLQLMCVM